MKRFFVLAIVLIVSCFSFVSPSNAANFTVNDASSLIAAITTANSNGEADIITLTADIDLTVGIDFTDGVNGLPSILPDGGNSLTIEGNGFTIRRSSPATFRIMHIAVGANVFINDLTIENGFAGAGGLGTLGGGIFTWGQLSIDNSVFIGNSTSVGLSGLGAGIFIAQTTATITNSTLTNNNATGGGGGIYNYQSNLTLIGNAIYNNNGGTGGGGISNENSTITLVNNTISGNTSTFGGGGIYTLGGTLIFRNNTITNNTGGIRGGGIYNADGNITLHNTIIAGNTATNGSQCSNEVVFSGFVMNTNSFNILGTGGNAGGCPAGANDIVPAGAIGTIISPLANNNGPTLTHALPIGSPALDAANLANCPSDDQRGFLRGFNAVGGVNSPQTGDCDIGAFEYSLDPIYASTPIIGATLNFGSTPIGTQISTVLEIREESGSGALLVSLNSISGANAGDFNIIGLPTAIGFGNPPQNIAIICTPSASGLRTAQMTFNTNDPIRPTVTYDLQCTGTDNLVASASILGINQIVTEANTTLSITVQLDVPPGFSNTGNVTVGIVDATTGNATSGTDYTVFPPTNVTFTGPLIAGTSYTQTVTVSVLDDPDIEGAEAFALMINQVTGAGEIGFPDTHTVVINDNDADIFAQASFVANSAIINENAGTLTIDVQVFIPIGFNLTGDITLTISDSLGGTATSGADYTAFVPVTLTFVDAPFVAGTTYTQTITLDILDDTLTEGVETVDLGITGISGGVELVSPAQFTAIINDDEIATVIVTQPGDSVTVTVPVGEPEFVFKTVDNPFATIGQTVTYTIRARNPKSNPLTQVVIYDVFDERLGNIRLISTTHGTGVFNGNTLAVSGFTLQPNEEAVIIVSAQIAALKVGDTIPNAAILESPDASVHVSNLALVGTTVKPNHGGASQVFVIPSQLPNTGENPVWRDSVLWAGGLLLVFSMGFIFLGNRLKNRL